MRVVLFQSVVMLTAARWEKVISDPELRKEAIEATWIFPDGQSSLCLQWDNAKKTHMAAQGGNHVQIKEVSILLMELVALPSFHWWSTDSLQPAPSQRNTARLSF